MKLPIPTDLEPMEAQLRDELPEGGGWLYEPKWDGFRCLVFRDGEEIDLRSKAGKRLARYFPDIVEAIRRLGPRRFVLDGEIVIPVDGGLSFDDLLLRLHPAATRVRKLAEARPGVFIAFDLLVGARGASVASRPLKERRQRLEAFARAHLDDRGGVRVSPATDDVEIARQWLTDHRGELDGVMAKRLDLPYQAGSRGGMVKVKRLRSADCVVGGFRWTKAGGRVASLLLGLYGADGLLHHVGFCAALNEKRRAEADERLIPLAGGAGFSGRSPAERSRWRKEGAAEWVPVRPEVVVEVLYDHFTSGRFRHGTRFVRWRPDKTPRACALSQVERESASALELP
jgi:ATP-dependent DNA ligase